MPSTLTEPSDFNNPKDFSLDQLLELSGMLSIHPNPYSIFELVTINVLYRSQDVIVTITSLYIRKLQVVVNPRKKLITNNVFVSRGLKSGLAAKWVNRQVESASAFSFTILEGLAHRDDSDPNIKWIGYLLWPRLGYLMKYDDELLFLRMLRNHGRNEQSILELTTHADGLEFWKKYGLSYEIWFDLAPQSTSRSILDRYLRSKN